MTVREEVRHTRRRLAILDADHRRAVARLDQAVHRRSETLAEQDRLVAAARIGVDQAIAGMAEGMGIGLSAQLLGLDEAEVRRVAKAHQATPGRGDRDGKGSDADERARSPPARHDQALARGRSPSSGHGPGRRKPTAQTGWVTAGR